MKSFLAGLFLLISFQQLSAQRFGGFPPSTRWKQIGTDTATVIFSNGAEEQANRISALVHRMAADTPYALGDHLRNIRILLHNRTTYANGYVALGPFRSEFYLIPGANVYELGNLSWYENLAIHEYRHVQQYNNFRRGLSKAFLVFFGQEGLALANAMAVPDWFFEGDAVHSETALTESGRGRLPYFLSGFNSLWLEDRNYSWHKLRNGSMKDYVPNHYQLGYLLANYGYLKYGDEFWKKVTQDASSFRGLFYPFQQAVKRHSGVKFRTFRREAFDFYRRHLDSIPREAPPRTRTVTNYLYPQYTGRDSLLYLKTAYNRLPAFYIRKGNDEQKIGQRGISGEEWFSHRNGRIAFTTFSTHPRWSLVDYSDITVMDSRTGSRKRLTKNERYYTPDFSPSGNRLVAVRINDSLDTELHVLDATSGRVLKSVPAANDWYYTNPRYVDEQTIVVGRRSPDHKMSLQLYHLQDDRWEELLPASHHVISLPFAEAGTIYFTSNIRGNDDIYALQLKDRRLYRLTTGVTGHYFPSVDGGRMVWSHFTSAGMALREEELEKMKWEEVSPAAFAQKRDLFPVALAQPDFQAPVSRSSATRYSQSSGLLNFHSWRPDYYDPEFTFTLYSNNILNTFSADVFYRYNRNENSSGVGVSLAYGGLYPVLRISGEKIYNRSFSSNVGTLTFEQTELRPGFYIPWNFTRGKMYKFLTPGSDYVFSRSTPVGITRQYFRDRDIKYMRHFLNWSHYLPVALQHIYPKFGYSIATQFRHVFNDTGYQLVSHANLFLPSLGNHSIVISASVQQVDTVRNVIFSDQFSNPRGYDDLNFSRKWKVGANYHFPIAYPDFGVANIVYFQRLRGNAFFDYARVYSVTNKLVGDLRSTGGEIFFDTKWWNQQPVSFGFRISYLLDDGFDGEKKGSTLFEFILPLDLIPD